MGSSDPIGTSLINTIQARLILLELGQTLANNDRFLAPARLGQNWVDYRVPEELFGIFCEHVRQLLCNLAARHNRRKVFVQGLRRATLRQRLGNLIHSAIIGRAGAAAMCGRVLPEMRRCVTTLC